MEISISINKNGLLSAFVRMGYERAGRNPRNHLKGVRCMGLIVEAETAEQATQEMLNRLRPASLELSDQLMESAL